MIKKKLKVGDRMERYRKKNRETGQALVEWALVFPVFLLLVCGIIDFSWIGYQRLLFESSFQRTAWDFTLNLQHPSESRLLNDRDILEDTIPSPYDTSSPGNVVTVGSGDYALGQGIKVHMLQGAAGLLKEDELNVSSVKAVFNRKEVTEVYPNEAGGEGAEVKSYQLLVDLTGILEYRVELLTPVSRLFIPSGEVIFKKNLVRERTERVVVKRRVMVPST